MADVTITGLPNASTLTGAERVPMDQSGTTVDAAASAIAALATKTTVGLSNVNNTSDADKPISTATQEALNAKATAGAVGSSGLTMTAGVLGRESGTGAPVVLSFSGLSIVNGVLTVTAGGSGTVTSVAMSVPTGFSVAGSPITTTGTLAVTFAAGYSLPLISSQASWDVAAALAATAVQPAGLTSYVQTSDARLSDSREWSAATVSQAQAEAGTSTSRLAFTPLRVFQSVAAYISANFSAVGQSLASAANAAAARATLELTATATATPAGGLSIQSGNLVPSDVIKLVVSNKGETATAAANYVETTVQRACTVVGAFWELAPSATGSSSSQAMAYARRSGTKTSLLSANASLAASAILTDASANLTGTLTLVTGDTVGVDLVSVGTGSSGHIFTLVIRYS